MPTLAEPEETTRQDIVHVLTAVAPEFCELIGPMNVGSIVERVATGETPQIERIGGGADFDLHLAFEIVAKSATFVSACLNIARYLQERHGKAPATTEVLEELQRRRIAPPKEVDASKAASEAIVKTQRR